MPGMIATSGGVPPAAQFLMPQAVSRLLKEAPEVTLKTTVALVDALMPMLRAGVEGQLVDLRGLHDVAAEVDRRRVAVARRDAGPGGEQGAPLTVVLDGDLGEGEQGRGGQAGGGGDGEEARRRHVDSFGTSEDAPVRQVLILSDGIRPAMGDI